MGFITSFLYYWIAILIFVVFAVVFLSITIVAATLLNYVFPAYGDIIALILATTVAVAIIFAMSDM